MDNMEYDKFLGKLYDILLKDDIIGYNDKAKDLKTKKQRLESYLEKLGRIQDKALSKDKLDIIKELYYNKYIIKKEDIPNSYFEFLERRYLEEGHGHINLVNPKNNEEIKLKEAHIEEVIKEQKDSLDSWLNYLLSSDSSYLPMWAKVWAFQGMLHIGNLNELKDGYKTRGKTTVNPFVTFDSEILGKCVELLKESLNKKDIKDEEIDKIVSSGSFAKLYGKLLANKKTLKIDSDEGIWIKYNYETKEEVRKKEEKGIEAEYLKLYNSLQGYNTGWCTAGSKETAKSQICGGESYGGGDFYVYYSKDKNGEYKVPRIAIRMDENKIGEIRGIAQNQHIESNMERILEEKLKEFPDADEYQKKVNDMKKLTDIYNKHINNIELSKEELRFLYEIDSKIIGFGYKDDPRIEEIIKNRNKRKDLTLIFNCSKDEIGFKEEDLERDLIYYWGNIDLSEREIIYNLKLPKHIRGNLWLSSLTSAEWLTLPESIGGYLDLKSLMSVEGLILPESIGGGLILKSLLSAEGLILSENFRGSLDLRDLVNGKGLVLPKIIKGDLNLSSLIFIEDLVLPKIIKGDLNLSSLIFIEDLVLPESIDGNLYLESLISAEGLIFPKNIGGELYLSSLRSLKGFVFPEKCGEVFYNGLYYPLEEIRMIQHYEEMRYNTQENSINSKTKLGY